MEMIGKKFGRLTVVSEAKRGTQRRWNVICDCGISKEVYGGNLRNGSTQSCGCLQKECHITHGKYGSPEHRVWATMINRCINPAQKYFSNYGGRGIVVCEQWKDFSNFIADMGERPTSKHQIDRYPNNDGNYEPGNCRWATCKENSRNRRGNALIQYDGRQVTVAEASELSGIHRRTLSARLAKGKYPFAPLEQKKRNGRAAERVA
jgi:hypothetical protein